MFNVWKKLLKVMCHITGRSLDAIMTTGFSVMNSDYLLVLSLPVTEELDSNAMSEFTAIGVSVKYESEILKTPVTFQYQVVNKAYPRIVKDVTDDSVKEYRFLRWAVKESVENIAEMIKVYWEQMFHLCWLNTISLIALAIAGIEIPYALIHTSWIACIVTTVYLVFLILFYTLKTYVQMLDMQHRFIYELSNLNISIDSMK